MTLTIRLAALVAGLLLALLTALPTSGFDAPFVLILALAGFLYLCIRLRPYFLGPTTGLFFHFGLILATCMMWSFAVAVLSGADRWEALHQLGRFWLFLSLLLIAVRHSQRVGTAILTVSVSAVLLLHVMAAFGEALLLGGSVVHGFRRLSGIAGSPNNLGNILMLAAIWFFSWMVWSRQTGRPRAAVLTSICFGICVGALVLSATLKNLVAFFVVIVLGSALQLGRLRSRKSVLPVAIALVFSVGIVLGNTTMLTRVYQTAAAGIDFQVQLGDERASSSLQWRVLHWKLLTDSWVQTAPLRGVGLGQGRFLEGLPRLAGDEREGRTAHSDVLQSIFEMGAVMGSVANVTVLFALWWLLRRILVFGEAGPYQLAAFLGASALWLAGMFGNVVSSAAFLYVFPLILGGALGGVVRSPYRHHVTQSSEDYFIPGEEIGRHHLPAR